MAEQTYYPSSTGRAYDNYEYDNPLIYKSKSDWSYPTYISQGGVHNWNWTWPVHCNYYGAIYFDFTAICQKAKTHIPVRIRLRLRSATANARTVYVHMGKGMAKDSYSSSKRPTDATGTTRKSVACAGSAWCEINTTDETWLSALLDPETTCFYINYTPTGYGSGSHSDMWDTGAWWTGYGSNNASYKPQLYIDWIPRGPLPSAPPLNAIGEIHEAETLFSWGTSADASGIFQPEQLSYEMQISVDGGSSWGDTHPIDAGVLSHLVDLRTYLGFGLPLEAEQYYFNETCKARVRAVTPLWPDDNGKSIPSEWSESGAFTINYKIAPAAPGSLTPSKSAPYEGEDITFSMDRPALHNYNTHASPIYEPERSNPVMDMAYHAVLANGTPLANGNADVTHDGIVLNYHVGELTTGKTDLTTSIKARCVDAEGQQSPDTGKVDFTIKRFRAPIVVITGDIERAETSAIVHIRIMDTGYALPQSGDQIRKIQYKIYPEGEEEPVDYSDGTLGAWTNLDNSFTINKLIKGTRYDLKIRVVNKKPEVTELEDLPGAYYQDMLLSYLPMDYGFCRPEAQDDEAGEGHYAQASIIGDNPEVPVDKGCQTVQYDIDAGRDIRKNGKSVLTTDDLPEDMIEGTPGVADNPAAWDADGKLVDGLEHDETTGSGYVRGYYKYADGRLECYYVRDLTNISITSTWASQYYYNVSNSSVEFPVPFTSLEMEWAWGICDDPSCWMGQPFSQYVPASGLSLTNWSNFYLFSNNSRSGVSARIFMRAIGRWK